MPAYQRLLWILFFRLYEPFIHFTVYRAMYFGRHDSLQNVAENQIICLEDMQIWRKSIFYSILAVARLVFLLRRTSEVFMLPMSFS